MWHSRIPFLKVAANAGAKQSYLAWGGSLMSNHTFWLDINDARPHKQS